MRRRLRTEYFDYYERLIDEKLANPDDGVTSHLSTARSTASG